MLSADFIRDNREKVIKAAKDKNRAVDVDEIIRLDDKRRQLLQAVQKLRGERRELAKQKPVRLGEAQPRQNEMIKTRGRNIKEELKRLSAEQAKIVEELTRLLSFVPNVPLDETPVGKDSSSNLEVRRWGVIPQFDFLPKSHLELARSLDIVDFARGVKVSGVRGYFLKNEGALLHLGLLWQVFLTLAKKGYTPLIAPSVVREFTLFGSGQLPWGTQEVYRLDHEDRYLAGTAEVPVTGYFADEILSEKDLPKKMIAFSPCFRREAGSYGRDTKGLYRLHEFWKVEQVIFAQDDLEKAKELHEELQKNTEEIIKNLGLPYRVMLMCTGEMGEPQMKKYDTEIWMPYRQDFGEIASNSFMGDFQARRLKIKYRKKDGGTAYCYTLNNTALASPRMLIAILENYQQEDGSVVIPQALRSLLGFDKILPQKK